MARKGIRIRNTPDPYNWISKDGPIAIGYPLPGLRPIVLGF
jgi:hypothetical protein